MAACLTAAATMSLHSMLATAAPAGCCQVRREGEVVATKCSGLKSRFNAHSRLPVALERRSALLCHPSAALSSSSSSSSRRRQAVVPRVVPNSLEAAANAVAGGKEIVPDTEISITKTSFGTIGLTVGVFLLSYGFGAYFTLLPGTDSSAIMLTYGFPIALIGFALKYAELKPVPCTSFADAVALRENEATPILQQVRSDVTRYRYGDEQHLDEALKRIFRYNLSGGIQRRNAPTLTSISEEVFDGRYSLVLNFSAPALELKDFEERQAKFTSFFGPNVEALTEQGQPKEYKVRLVSTVAKPSL